MKRQKINLAFGYLFLLLLYSCTLQQAETEQAHTLKLWYEEPALAWEEALPLGNGRLGAMIFGGIENETIQLNENTLWSGYPADGNNPQAQNILPEIRTLIDREEYKEAADLWKKHAQGPYTARYLPMADLHLQMKHAGEAIDYYRDLNISHATASVQYKVGEVTYGRTAFISHPDQVFVMKLEADQKGKLNFDLSLSSKLRYKVEKAEENQWILRGKAPLYVAHRRYDPDQVVYTDDENGEGMTFEVHLQVVNKGGKISSGADRITLEGAHEAMVILSAATSFNGFDQSPVTAGKAPGAIASAYLKKAIAQNFKQLRTTHIKDHRSLFDRVKLSLDSKVTEAAALPTNQRLSAFAKDDSDHGMVELYYQFGRYLTIASSRKGGVPSNLQGVWNPHVQPPWGSNYTTNINTEMNYWPAEMASLPECHVPLLDFIKSLSVNGEKTARINYGAEKGWVAHHNSDIWAQTAPAGNFDKDLRGSMARFSCWAMSGGWFSRHLWEHYLFGGDIDFLKNEAYPLMKGAAEFMLFWLQEDTSGYLVTNPSSSPENVFSYRDKQGKLQQGEISKATTMDMAIIRDLFSNCIRASEVLKTDEAFRNQLKEYTLRLFPPQIGNKGQLQEWFKDFEEPDPTHRHASHLYGLHPGYQISPRLTPGLSAATRQTLLLRDFGGTGWAMAWKLNFWARLEESENAYRMLKQGMRHVDVRQQTKGGGTYSNLFDAHPPFQIDGNFGATSGVTEMLVQSHTEEIFLLPALPASWPNGSIRGIRAKGGFTIDLEWEAGQVKHVEIHSSLGGNCRIRSEAKLSSSQAKLLPATGVNPNEFYRIPSEAMLEDRYGSAEPLSLKETVLTDFSTEKGKKYLLIAE